MEKNKCETLRRATFFGNAMIRGHPGGFLNRTCLSNLELDTRTRVVVIPGPDHVGLAVIECKYSLSRSRRNTITNLLVYDSRTVLIFSNHLDNLNSTLSK